MCTIVSTFFAKLEQVLFIYQANLYNDQGSHGTSSVQRVSLHLHLSLFYRDPLGLPSHSEGSASHLRQPQLQQPGAGVVHHAHGGAARCPRLVVRNDGSLRAACFCWTRERQLIGQ